MEQEEPDGTKATALMVVHGGADEGRSPTELVERSDKVQPEQRSPEAMAGQQLTKAEPEGQRSPVELVGRRVMVETRELGA